MTPFKEEIRRQIEDNIRVKEALLAECQDVISNCAEILIAALKSGGKILFCGNGGSAADAQHLATELVVRLRGSFNRPSIPALALTVDTSLLTAAGNDLGFDQIFARQIESLGKKEDVLIGISTSGNSVNVLEAIKTASSNGLKTMAFLGGSGGAIAAQAETAVVVPSNDTARIQECHILVGHILCLLIEESLFPPS
ncbi:MAG: D-sedoheptulose 7-phosphate isomerase [Calditrichota bacterium]